MTNCSLFMKVVSSEYLQYMLCTQIVILFCLDIQNNFGTQHVLQILRASEKDLPVICGQNLTIPAIGRARTQLSLAY